MFSMAPLHLFLSIILSSLLYSSLTTAQAHIGQDLQDRQAAAVALLSLRQTTTCPGGGLCDLGKICCGSGCMFSSSTCCGDPYFCYAGETCSTPDSVGNINCCVGTICTPAKFVIQYARGAAGLGSALWSTAAASISHASSPSSAVSVGGESSSLGMSLTVQSTGSTQSSQYTVATPTLATGAASVVTSPGSSSTLKAAAAGLVKASVRFELRVVVLTNLFFLAM